MREPAGTIERVDPLAGYASTVELDIRRHFREAWGFYPPGGASLPAYNRMTPTVDPNTGEPVHLLSLWVTHPDTAADAARPLSGWILVRHADRTYSHARIHDLSLVPHPELRGVRDIEPSPWAEDGGRVYYLGGYDCASDPSHETAWIARLVVPEDVTPPDPAGGGHEVLVGYLEPSRTIVRIDPLHDHAVTEELDLPAYFTAAWGGPATINYAAYNDMLQSAHPGGCETVNLIGIWGEHPDPIGTPARNNSWYLVRRGDGSYGHGQVIDPAIPVPSKRLRALRTIARSPFPQDGGRVFYAGGYDAGGPYKVFHNTAWIYRGVIPADTTPPAAATGLRLARAGRDLDFAWDRVQEDTAGRRECLGNYVVWRAQNADFHDAVPLQETPDAGPSLRVSGEAEAGPGAAYYQVRARDAAGNAGP